jgi:hypothetical protein
LALLLDLPLTAPLGLPGLLDFALPAVFFADVFFAEDFLVAPFRTDFFFDARFFAARPAGAALRRVLVFLFFLLLDFDFLAIVEFVQMPGNGSQDINGRANPANP